MKKNSKQLLEGMRDGLPIALGYVGSDGNGCPLELGTESEPFIIREGCADFIRLYNKSMSLLPRIYFLKTLRHTVPLTPFTTYYFLLTPFTTYYSKPIYFFIAFTISLALMALACS